MLMIYLQPLVDCPCRLLNVGQRPKRTHPPPVSKHLECLSFHENWWAPVQRRSASKRCPPQCQKQLTSQSVKPTLRVGPLWTPIYTLARHREGFLRLARRSNCFFF